MDNRAIRAVQAKGLQHGADHPHPGVIDWDIAGRCQSPQVVEHHARASGRHARRQSAADIAIAKVKALYPDAVVLSRPEETRPPNFTERTITPGRDGYDISRTVRMTVACRKCAFCMNNRRALWSKRAIAETRQAARTWFVTLTLHPDVQHRCLMEARHHEDKQGVSFEALPEDERFSLHAARVGQLLTRYIKRLRKESGAKLRYIAVFEKHQSGLPHLHLLVHEQSAVQPVRHETLRRQWPHGFSTHKLIDLHDNRQAAYVCKYLSKSSAARVRASARYGKTNDLSHSSPNKVKGRVNPRPPERKLSDGLNKENSDGQGLPTTETTTAA